MGTVHRQQGLVEAHALASFRGVNPVGDEVLGLGNQLNHHHVYLVEHPDATHETTKARDDDGRGT